MTYAPSFKWASCILGTFLLTSAVASSQSVRPDGQGFIAAQLEDLQIPESASNIVVLGDPSKPGIYVVRNVFRPGRFSSPHFHDQDRYVTVIKGTWWVSLGPESDKNDRNKMTPMKAGSFVFHPANGHHFDGAKDEEAVVQIMGMGPVKTVQLTQPSAPGQE